MTQPTKLQRRKFHTWSQLLFCLRCPEWTGTRHGFRYFCKPLHRVLFTFRSLYVLHYRSRVEFSDLGGIHLPVLQSAHTSGSTPKREREFENSPLRRKLLLCPRRWIRPFFAVHHRPVFTARSQRKVAAPPPLYFASRCSHSFCISFFPSSSTGLLPFCDRRVGLCFFLEPHNVVRSTVPLCGKNCRSRQTSFVSFAM